MSFHHGRLAAVIISTSGKLAVSFGGVVSPGGWRGPRRGRRHRVLVVTGVDIVKKSAFIVISLLALTGSPVVAGTSAQVEYGTVQESRLLTQEAPRQGTTRPLRTIGAAALGAAVGSQFGGGSGQTVATTVGAVAGAEVSRRRQGNQQSEQGRQTVELLIKTEAGKLLNVVQEQDPALTFAKGDRVRILTTGVDTRVDKSV